MNKFDVLLDCLDGGKPDTRTLPPLDSTTQKDEDKHPCIVRVSNPRSEYQSVQDPRSRPRDRYDRLQESFNLNKRINLKL